MLKEEMLAEEKEKKEEEEEKSFNWKKWSLIVIVVTIVMIFLGYFSWNSLFNTEEPTKSRLDGRSSEEIGELGTELRSGGVDEEKEDEGEGSESINIS